MRYVGFLFVLLASFVISREYAAYVEKRLTESRDFLSFIRHMKIQVGCFLRPTNELVRDFSSDRLSELGFTEALMSGETLYSAYKRAEPELTLSGEERELFEVLFSSVGECYLEEGVRLIDGAEKRLEEIYRKNKLEYRKGARLVSIISVTAAMGFLLLLL